MAPNGWLRALSLLLFVALVALGNRALAFVPPPIQGHVTDTAGKLSPKDVSELNEALSKYRKATGNEIAVFLLPSLGGETIEDVAYTTFNTWHVGRAKLDNGVLLVIAPGERKIRIETGKGVGGKLPDLLASDIIRERIGPRLKEERFREGVEDGVLAIEAALDGKPLPERRAATAPQPTSDAPKKASFTPPPAPAGYIVDLTGRLRQEEMEAFAEANLRALATKRPIVAALVVPRVDDETHLEVLYGTKSMWTNTIRELESGGMLLLGLDDGAVYIAAPVEKGVVVETYAVRQGIAKALSRGNVRSALLDGAESLRSAIAGAGAEVRSKEEREWEAQRFALIMWGIIGGGFVLIVAIIVIGRRRAQRRPRNPWDAEYASYSGGGGDWSSSSSSSSSSSDSSWSSSSSSSSSDSSYSGGGGSSGGGGASDSY